MSLERVHMDDYVLIITTDAALDEWCAALNNQDSVAMDTEGDSLHCYFEKLCLIQIPLGAENVLIDPLEPLDFSKFNTLLSKRRVILHGCDYDLRMLRRGIKFTPGEVFDTYLAARLVGMKEVGLASLVKEFFGIDLPKSSQKANWAKRPLTQAMIEYAIRDSAAEAVQAGVTPLGGDRDALWAIAWRARSAAWMVRHRALLESALT